MKKRIVGVCLMAIGLVACGKQERDLENVIPTINVDLGLDVITPTVPVVKQQEAEATPTTSPMLTLAADFSVSTGEVFNTYSGEMETMVTGVKTEFTAKLEEYTKKFSDVYGMSGCTFREEKSVQYMDAVSGEANTDYIVIDTIKIINPAMPYDDFEVIFQRDSALFDGYNQVQVMISSGDGISEKHQKIANGLLAAVLGQERADYFLSSNFGQNDGTDSGYLTQEDNFSAQMSALYTKYVSDYSVAYTYELQSVDIDLIRYGSYQMEYPAAQLPVIDLQSLLPGLANLEYLSDTFMIDYFGTESTQPSFINIVEVKEGSDISYSLGITTSADGHTVSLWVVVSDSGTSVTVSDSTYFASNNLIAMQEAVDNMVQRINRIYPGIQIDVHVSDNLEADGWFVTNDMYYKDVETMVDLGGQPVTARIRFDLQPVISWDEGSGYLYYSIVINN